MPDKPKNPFQFWEELKRRRVIRVIPVYAAAAFVLLELVDIISEPFGLPDWTLKLVTVLLVIGFIISVILSWIYDVTSEGIEKTKPSKEVASVEKQPASKGWKIATFVSILIIIAFVVFYLVGNTKRSSDISKLEKSIAVLPLEYLSEDPSKQYLANGVLDAITGHLSMIEGLRVMPRTSVEQYRENKKSAQEIGEELDVSYLIEGSFFMVGDQVKLIIQLVVADEGSHVFYGEYDRNYKDIMAVQSEVAQTIAKEIEVALTPKVNQRIESIPTKNIEAYDYYLKGNEMYWSLWDSMDVRKVYESVELYNKAVALDEKFSFAYTGLGRSYWMLAHLESDTERNVYWEKSKEYLNKAIQLDSNNGWAYAEMGVVQSNYDWDSTGTRKSFDKAIELMPNDWNAYIHYFFHEFRLGNCEKLRWIMEAEKRFAPRIDRPIGSRNLLILTCQKNYEEIVSIATKYWAEGFDPQRAYIIISAAIATDSFGIADSVLQYINETVKGRKDYLLYKATVHSGKGNVNTALEIIDSLNILSTQEFIANTFYASIYASIGDEEEMYNYLNLALESREKELHDLNFYSVFDPYLNEHRFKEIVRKMWIPINSN